MKKLKYINLDELISSVKEDFHSFDDMGLIDKSRIIKTIMWCNEKLGLPVHQIKEKFIKVRDYKAELPLNFWKVTYVCALETGSFGISGYRDPFNNTVTEQMKAEAEMCTYVAGCETKCSPLIIRRERGVEVFKYTHWTELKLSKSSSKFLDKNHLMHREYDNNGGDYEDNALYQRPKYTIDIEEEEITLPFREGELYIMYVGTMEDDEGNMLIPFHPLITNWYEWSVKEKILQDLIFNSDADVANMLKLAQLEKSKSWLDAWNFQMEPEYRQAQQWQAQKEANFHNKYFKLLL